MGAGAGCSEHRPSACSGSPQGATAPRFSKKAPQGPHPRLKDPVPVRKTRPDLRSLPPNTQQNQANLGGSERDPSVEKAWEEHQQAELWGLWRQRAHPGGCLPWGLPALGAACHEGPDGPQALAWEEPLQVQPPATPGRQELVDKGPQVRNPLPSAQGPPRVLPPPQGPCS